MKEEKPHENRIVIFSSGGSNTKIIMLLATSVVTFRIKMCGQTEGSDFFADAFDVGQKGSCCDGQKTRTGEKRNHCTKNVGNT